MSCREYLAKQRAHHAAEQDDSIFLAEDADPNPERFFGLRPFSHCEAGAAAATSARCGQTLTVEAVGRVEAELALRVDDVAGTQTPLQIDIVRNGEIHRRIEATTPFEGRWRETVEAEEGSAYYRVIVRATRAAYLVSNPVFLQRRP